MQQIHTRTTVDAPAKAVVAEAVVDDPYATYPGEKIRVTLSTRDDPLAEMRARKQIDEAQFIVGRLWQTHHENSEIGGVKAIDPTKEAVDGGRMAEPLGEIQIRAFRRLNEARTALGFQGHYLISCILGERLSVQQTSTRLGLTTEREFNYISRRFRECLETLAKLWGYA